METAPNVCQQMVRKYFLPFYSFDQDKATLSMNYSINNLLDQPRAGQNYPDLFCKWPKFSNDILLICPIHRELAAQTLVITLTGLATSSATDNYRNLSPPVPEKSGQPIARSSDHPPRVKSAIPPLSPKSSA
jgi:hypothetical protein